MISTECCEKRQKKKKSLLYFREGIESVNKEIIQIQNTTLNPNGQFVFYSTLNILQANYVFRIFSILTAEEKRELALQFVLRVNNDFKSFKQ